MEYHLAYTRANYERITAVENSFGAFGQPLMKPGRVLIAEGRLMKMCRRTHKPKMFFLFNDILVYGGIVMHSCWYSHQHIIPLEDIVIENQEDCPELQNHWLIRTPRKSFYVSAASLREKQEWIIHLEKYRAHQLTKSDRGPSGNLAAIWIPDRASEICMRCTDKFTVTQRRHHCRQCGFIVCNACSKCRFLIPTISSSPVRVCILCFNNLQEEKDRKDKGRNRWSDDFDCARPTYEVASEDETVERVESKWAGSQGPALPVGLKKHKK
ncbi:pleckstrin homology domain-containing family F member 2-like [Polypterus senegalus]